MKRLHGFGVVLGIFAALALVVSCQSTITNPPEATSASLEMVGATQAGLAKHGELSHSRNIPANAGGILGGAQTGGNFIEIPGDALEENMFLTFTVTVDNQGVLIFEITGNSSGADHINLSEGYFATVAVNKGWLAEEPDVLVNYDDHSEVIEGVIETPTHFIIHVPHFSRWSWGILEAE